MEVTILRDAVALERLKATWGGLPLANPFARWEFARHGLEHPSVEPFTLVVRGQDGQVLAMAPWSLRKKVGGIRLLEGIWGYDAWHHDPWIASPSLDKEVSALLVDALRQSRGEWDAIDLILTERSEALIVGLKGLGWGSTDRPGDRQNRVIHFAESWETYWNSRSKDFRSTLRGAQRKLDSLPHRYVEAGALDYQPLLEAGIRFSQERWDPDGNRETWYAALRDLAAAAAPRGELGAYALEIEGRIRAVNITFRAGERAYGTLQGYDPAFAAYRLGNLLGAWALQRLAASGIRWVDMGDGALTWKERFKTGQRETVLVRIGSSWSGKAFVGWQNWLKPQLSGLRQRPAH